MSSRFVIEITGHNSADTSEGGRGREGHGAVLSYHLHPSPRRPRRWKGQKTR